MGRVNLKDKAGPPACRRQLYVYRLLFQGKELKIIYPCCKKDSWITSNFLGIFSLFVLNIAETQYLYTVTWIQAYDMELWCVCEYMLITTHTGFLFPNVHCVTIFVPYASCNKKTKTTCYWLNKINRNTYMSNKLFGYHLSSSSKKQEADKEVYNQVFGTRLP